MGGCREPREVDDWANRMEVSTGLRFHWVPVEILCKKTIFNLYWAQVYIKICNGVQQEPCPILLAKLSETLGNPLKGIALIFPAY